MKKREIAPTECPKSGEERLWKPAAVKAAQGTAAAAGVTTFLFGALVGGAVASSIKPDVVYLCGKCGFSGKYMAD